MRPTTPLQKLIISAINVIIVLAVYSPLHFLIQSTLNKKLLIVAIFFITHQLFILTKTKHCIGMRLMKTKYKTIPTNLQYTIYSTLYTASFTTLLFHIYFPLDIFLVNMLLIQLPTIILTGTTFHGYLSGNISTVKI
jgi:hypothetical protein